MNIQSAINQGAQILKNKIILNPYLDSEILMAKVINKKVLAFCAVAPAYDLSLSSEDFFTTFILLLQN